MEGPSGQVGFFQKWVAPALFAIVVVAALWFLVRMSLKPLGPDSEMPEKHVAVACPICHRIEQGFDPMTLLDD